MGDNPPAIKKGFVYFPNLDGIRAIAALMVVVSHIEYHKVDYGFLRFGFLNISHLGKVGVTIFFALSGFLITYLLLEEKKKFKKVALKDFYIRRILRIWPLYFLIVIIGFFIYPAQGSTTALWFSVFFIPNLAFSLHMLPSIFDPIWSIGTEEQFYIFHPHIFKIKKLQNILKVLVLILVGLIVFSLIIRNLPYKNVVLADLSQFLYYARFDNMMIGAIIAVLYYNTKTQSFRFWFQGLFNLMFKKIVQWFLLLTFFAFVYLYVTYEVPQGDLVIATLAGLLIVNLCEPATSIISLGNSKLRYIGKISYGVYLLHKYPLFLIFYLVKTYLPGANFTVQNVVIYTATIISVTAVASAFYYGYERYFLRMKSRFQKITQNKSQAG